MSENNCVFTVRFFGFFPALFSLFFWLDCSEFEFIFEWLLFIVKDLSFAGVVVFLSLFLSLSLFITFFIFGSLLLFLFCIVLLCSFSFWSSLFSFLFDDIILLLLLIIFLLGDKVLFSLFCSFVLFKFLLSTPLLGFGFAALNLFWGLFWFCFFDAFLSDTFSFFGSELSLLSLSSVLFSSFLFF